MEAGTTGAYTQCYGSTDLGATTVADSLRPVELGAYAMGLTKREC